MIGHKNMVFRNENLIYKEILLPMKNESIIKLLMNSFGFSDAIMT